MAKMHSIVRAGLFALLLACSDSHEVSGGGSATETTNGLQALILRSNGSPAAGAVARLRAADYLPGDLPDSSRRVLVGSDGVLLMDSIPAGNWRLEVRDAALSLLWDLRLGSDSLVLLGADTVRKTATIRGSVGSGIAPGSRVGVLGTDHFAWVDSTGRFTLDSLPAGVHTVQLLNSSSLLRAYATVTAGGVSNVGELRAEAGARLLLDDFEDRNTQHRFVALAGQSWWYLDASDGVTLSGVAGSPLPLDSGDAVFGRSLHFSADFSGADTGSWVDCGVQIGLRERFYDLSGVDSLVFWAKGNGSPLVAFYLKAGNIRKPLTLHADWSRYAVPLDSMVFVGTSGTQPDRAAAVILAWKLIGTGELWLDEIELVGAKATQIWQP